MSRRGKGTIAGLFTILTTSGEFRIALLSLDTGAYRILIEKGSFARYVSTGHLVYASGEVLLAVPFDLKRLGSSSRREVGSFEL